MLQKHLKHTEVSWKDKVSNDRIREMTDRHAYVVDLPNEGILSCLVTSAELSHPLVNTVLLGMAEGN